VALEALLALMLVTLERVEAAVVAELTLAVQVVLVVQEFLAAAAVAVHTMLLVALGEVE
jgi:hypothetical protein